MEQFKAALKSFFMEICTMLVGELPQQRQWVRVVQENDNRTSFPIEMRNDFSGILLRSRFRILDAKLVSLSLLIEAIQRVPELCSILLVDAAGEPIIDEKGKEWWLENTLVFPMLDAYVSRANGFQFDEHIFNELFDAFQKDIPDITVTELSPLINVEMESNQIQIDDNMWLRRLSTNELEEWFNEETLLMSQPLPKYELLDLKSAVEIVYRQKRPFAFGSTEAREKVSRLLTAIRLLTDASTRLAFTKILSFLSLGVTTMGTFSALRYGPPVMIDKSQESGLVELYRKLSSGPNLKKIGLAIERWNGAADRPTEEDKLIDYWIALESLFVPEDTQEVRYRAALRIAVFLGTSGVERKEIYEHMGKSYRLRSEIVHGSIRKQNKKVNPTELIRLSRSYLRQALLKILASSDCFDPSNLEVQLLEKE